MASSIEASTQGAMRRSGASPERIDISTPAAPKASAIDGAPLAASIGRAAIVASRERPVRYGLAARPYMKSAAPASCASSGVVSCPSCSRPRVAITASTAPSAMVRA